MINPLIENKFHQYLLGLKMASELKIGVSLHEDKKLIQDAVTFLASVKLYKQSIDLTNNDKQTLGQWIAEADGYLKKLGYKPPNVSAQTHTSLPASQPTTPKPTSLLSQDPRFIALLSERNRQKQQATINENVQIEIPSDKCKL
ncbi:MAG: hypothetical protein P4M14_07595 [Gammaproteobacteria bacterium]|nr:hypothetical protein [Gammaproteobacteria bacterium]